MSNTLLFLSNDSNTEGHLTHTDQLKIYIAT